MSYVIAILPSTVSLEADDGRPPGRVADIIAYLLSDAGHGITGLVIHLDDRNHVK